jgi:hypothetical protein
METNQVEQKPQMSQEDIMLEVLDNSRKTKRYMQWQFYITIVLVVLPMLVMAFAIPMILRNVTGMYSGLLQ